MNHSLSLTLSTFSLLKIRVIVLLTLADYLSLEVFQHIAMVKLNLLVTLFQVLVSLVWLPTFLNFRCCGQDCT